MHYLTTDPKVKPTQLEHHLINVGQNLARKNHHLGMIQNYLEDVIDEWKTTRQKYAHAKTRMYFRQSTSAPVQLECLNLEGQVVFIIK